MMKKKLLNFLKVKELIISFPDYFKDENISLKKLFIKSYLIFNRSTSNWKNNFNYKIFKKIVLIDPNIADAVTTSKIYDHEHRNDCTLIKSRIYDKYNDMNFSLDKIIKAIYNSNIYSDKNDPKTNKNNIKSFKT